MGEKKGRIVTVPQVEVLHAFPLLALCETSGRGHGDLSIAQWPHPQAYLTDVLAGDQVVGKMFTELLNDVRCQLIFS